MRCQRLGLGRGPHELRHRVVRKSLELQPYDARQIGDREADALWVPADEDEPGQRFDIGRDASQHVATRVVHALYVVNDDESWLSQDRRQQLDECLTQSRPPKPLIERAGLGRRRHRCVDDNGEQR